MSRPKIFSFQFKLDLNEYHVGLPQLLAVLNPLNFVNYAHCYWAGFWCKECALIKLIGITAHKQLLWQAEMALICLV